MSDYTKLPRDIADCLKRGGAPLTDDQVIMLAGYLAPIQEQLTTAQAENAALRGLVDAAVKCHALDEFAWRKKARDLLTELDEREKDQ